MKLRYFAIVYGLLLLICIVFTINMFSSIEVNEVDTVTLNSDIEEIKENLDSGVSVSSLENIYECTIILESDSYYAIKVNDALKSNSTIIDFYLNDTYQGKVAFPGSEEKYNHAKENAIIVVTSVFSVLAVLGVFLFTYIYFRYIKPFKKLDTFATEISKGNLEIPLSREKGDYFGAFSEAFDSMREALRKAREGEYQANKSKKELIASLSHDIKTPISTIRALCELMSVKISDQDILHHIEIIDSKALMVDTLINNMFTAALEELEVLKINVKEEPSTIIKDIFQAVNYYNKIEFINDVPEFLVYMDKLRFTQVIDNVVNNSYKYANTKIEVSFIEQDGGIKILIRDFGPGCSEDDLPLLTEKFYRGKNSSVKDGSGLGLYLASSFMSAMQGDFKCENDNGFLVTLFLKKI